jgi:spermidine/putrescine transport system permease protein
VEILVLGAVVTLLCVLIGFPCAWVLAKTIKGRWREALFLLVILPFWSNALVRVFSWAIVLRGNGILDRAARRRAAVRRVS